MREIILSPICKYGSAFQIEALRDARKNFVISIYFAEDWQPCLSREIHLRSNLNFKPVKFCSSWRFHARPRVFTAGRGNEGLELARRTCRNTFSLETVLKHATYGRLPSISQESWKIRRMIVGFVECR